MESATELRTSSFELRTLHPELRVSPFELQNFSYSSLILWNCGRHFLSYKSSSSEQGVSYFDLWCLTLSCRRPLLNCQLSTCWYLHLSSRLHPLSWADNALWHIQYTVKKAIGVLNFFRFILFPVMERSISWVKNVFPSPSAFLFITDDTKIYFYSTDEQKSIIYVRKQIPSSLMKNVEIVL